jgi:diguanylate cyclase (GGDEF)-like protein
LLYTDPPPVSPPRTSKQIAAPLVDGEVLVVDDDAPTRALVLRWLKNAGLVCAEASNGEEALALLEANPSKYGVLVLDVMMPGMDGFEVLKRMKSIPGVADIPALFLTASATDADIVRGVESGAADYLLKPFSGPVLVAKLRAIRDRVRNETALRRKLKSVEMRAATDVLTGLLNRRSFDDRLVELTADSSRHREPLALLMLDIDRFKSVNDEFGHPAGDVALRFVADRVRRVLRLGDLAFRYGGEEFGVLLRKCDATGGVAVYDRLREELQRAPVDLGRGASRLITVSGGLATMERSNDFNAVDLVSRADAALYAAKHGGRDRVVLEGTQSA